MAPQSVSCNDSAPDDHRVLLSSHENVQSQGDTIDGRLSRYQSGGAAMPASAAPQSMAEHGTGSSLLDTKRAISSTTSATSIAIPTEVPLQKGVSNAASLRPLPFERSGPLDPRLVLFQGTQPESTQQQCPIIQAAVMDQRPQSQLAHSANVAAVASHRSYVANNTLYSLLQNFALLQQQRATTTMNTQEHIPATPEAVASWKIMPDEEMVAPETNSSVGENASEGRRFSDVSIDEELSSFLLSSLAIADRPVVTEEQEEAERQALTDEEKANLLSETYGRMFDDDDSRAKRARVDVPRRDIAFLIKQMRLEMDKIPLDQKQALSNAQLSMVCNRDEFSDDRLEIFLRCERFGAKMAALRYVNYWTARREVFGEKYLMRMTLGEALKEDAIALGLGLYTILPDRDISGRLVLYMEPRLHTRDGYTSESLLRAVWYVVEVAALESNHVTSGIVNIVFFKGSTIWEYDKTFDRWAYFLSSCWPIRLIANHLCCAPTMILRLAKPIIHSFVSKEFRARTLAHNVSEDDVAQALWTYGIHKLPTQMGGNVILEQESWIATRRAAELEEIL